VSLAVVIIAHEKRRETTFTTCLNSVRDQDPDEIVVVADFQVEAKGVRGIRVAPITRTTIDALIKRDVGWLATKATNVCFLSDDHALTGTFVNTFRREYARKEWDMLAPARFTIVGDTAVQLNMGQEHGYIGGHCGIYRRNCANLLPFTATDHHPNWDVIHTRQLKKLGANLLYAGIDLAILDLIPEDRPWVHAGPPVWPPEEPVNA
jgi:hypothetical protein